MGISHAPTKEPITLTDIFEACKTREMKERVAYIPVIPE